jgi:anti-sigma factor RsiW
VQGAVAKAVAEGDACASEVALLRADVARLEAELRPYRDDPIIRRYLALRRLMRGGPLPSRGGA